MMRALLLCCIIIGLLSCIPHASSQKISCTDQTNTTLTMTLDCVFLGPGPASITQAVLIRNENEEAVELTVEAQITLDDKTFNETSQLVLQPKSVIQHLWPVTSCGHPSLIRGSGNIVFNISIDNITCSQHSPNCQDNISMVEDASAIVGPSYLMIPPNNDTGLIIQPSKNELPVYAILNISSSSQNEAYRVQFELTTPDMPFSHIYITAGSQCPDSGPYVFDSGIDPSETKFTATVEHVAPGLLWIKLNPIKPLTYIVTITAEQKRIGPATCHKDTGMCENNRREKILIIVAMSVCVAIAMVVAVVVAYKQRPKPKKEPERFSLITGQ